MSFLNADSVERLLSKGVLQNDKSNILDDSGYIRENSLQLRIGPEAFTTTDPECKDRKLINLKDKILFNIESGQFALLITNEFISLPDNIMGFISLNTEFKYKGLINVSGFHVNPGWKGRLIFTIYNAGPHSIPIRFNEFAFRIWFSKLHDMKEFKINLSLKPAQATIDSNKIFNIDGDIFSPHLLGRKMQQYEKGLALKWVGLAGTLLLGFFVGLGVHFGTSVLQTFTGDNKLLLKEQLIAEIKDQIVDEALKQIQDHSTLTSGEVKQKNSTDKPIELEPSNKKP